jgi:hypothetical protein
MQEVEEKYKNFKLFVSEKAPASPMITMFMQIPLNLFLQTCYHHQKLRTKKKEITKSIFEKLGVTQKDFEPEDLAKFNRYVAYFLKASSIIGQQ